MYRCLRKHRALAACLFTALISSLTIALWSDRLWPLLISRLSLCSRSDSKFRLSRIRTQSSPAWLKNQVWLGQTEPIGLVVDTPSCQIPDFDAYNPSIRPYVRDPDPQFIVCNHSLPVTVTDGQYIRLNTTLAESLHIRHCFYQQVIRYDDRSSLYGEAVMFRSDVRLSDVEFVRVQCYNSSSSSSSSGRGQAVYTNFHAVARLKPDVERRCDELTARRHGPPPSQRAPPHDDDDDQLGLMNVLMIGIDSTSRLNSVRRLNSTRRFLLRQLSAEELCGYSRVGDNTYPNVMALLTGQKSNERPKGAIDLTPLLWKDFSAAGYRTLFVEDAYISNQVFNILNPDGFVSVPTDYYFRPLNVAMHGNCNLIDWRRREYRICTGPILEAELILNWVRDVVQITNANATHKLKQRPIFAFGFTSALTHGDMNRAVYVDVFLERFFQSLYDSGALNNTVVVLFSDHGVRYGSTRGYNRMSWYEENLPVALIAMPESFRRRRGAMMKTLHSNRHKLTTPFDLHETIRRLLDIGRPYDDNRRIARGRRGVSLFDITLGDRTCKDASIAPTYCECQLSQTHPVNVTSNQVQQVANATVEYMNKELMVHKGKCATMRLKAVLNAGMTKKTSAMMGEEHIYYTLTFRTSPGDGVFQAAVQWLGVKVHTDTDILRLNEYRLHAGCIQHVLHQKWCYCLGT